MFPVTLYCLVMAITGVIGITHPSPSLVALLGTLAFMYSVALVATSLVALAAILWQKSRLELTSFIFMAALTILHSLLIFVDGDPGNTQVGWRMLASAVGITLVADLRWQRGISKKEIERHLGSYRKGSSVD